MQEGSQRAKLHTQLGYTAQLKTIQIKEENNFHLLFLNGFQSKVVKFSIIQIKVLTFYLILCALQDKAPLFRRLTMLKYLLKGF